MNLTSNVRSANVVFLLMFVLHCLGSSWGCNTCRRENLEVEIRRHGDRVSVVKIVVGENEA